MEMDRSVCWRRRRTRLHSTRAADLPRLPLNHRRAGSRIADDDEPSSQSARKLRNAKPIVIVDRRPGRTASFDAATLFMNGAMKLLSGWRTAGYWWPTGARRVRAQPLPVMPFAGAEPPWSIARVLLDAQAISEKLLGGEKQIVILSCRGTITNTSDSRHRYLRYLTANAHDTLTHLPEIGAKNRYQKPGTRNRHENRPSPIRYQKLAPEKSVPNCMSDASETATDFFGTGFWRRFLVSVSWACNFVYFCVLMWSSGVINNDDDNCAAVADGL